MARAAKMKTMSRALEHWCESGPGLWCPGSESAGEVVPMASTEDETKAPKTRLERSFGRKTTPRRCARRSTR